MVKVNKEMLNALAAAIDRVFWPAVRVLLLVWAGAFLAAAVFFHSIQMFSWVGICIGCAAIAHSAYVGLLVEQAKK